MKLSAEQRDELRALVHRQDLAGVEAFIEKLHAPSAPVEEAPKPKAKGAR